MKTKSLVTFIFALVLGLGWSLAWADDFPETPTWRTVLKAGDTPDPMGPGVGVEVGVMEGLTGDNDGNFMLQTEEQTTPTTQTLATSGESTRIRVL